jgi:hypothetical protein
MNTSLLVVGLNNPQGNPPLHPHPPGVAGHRLWRLAYNVCGITLPEWLAATQRVNLLECRVLPPNYRSLAAHRGAVLAQFYRQRPAVLLGRAVARALGHEEPPLLITECEWVLLPHPSGRNRWYNNVENQRAVGKMLAVMLRISAPDKNDVGSVPQTG